MKLQVNLGGEKKTLVYLRIIQKPQGTRLSIQKVYYSLIVDLQSRKFQNKIPLLSL